MGEDGTPFPDFFPEDWEDDPEDAFDGADRGEGDQPEESPEDDGGGEAFPGALLLSGERPSDVMARVTRGDPLDVGGRSVKRLRERAFLIDSGRLCLRAMAHIAHGAPSYRGDPPLASWLQACIDEAIVELMEEDAYEEAAGQEFDGEWRERYGFLVDLLGIPPAKARKACIVFNALPPKDRRTFWAICVEGKSVHRYVAEGHGPPKKVEQRIEKVFRALSFLDEDDEAPPFDLGGDYR